MKTSHRYAGLTAAFAFLVGGAHAQQILSYYASCDLAAATGLNGERSVGSIGADSIGSRFAFHQSGARGAFDENLDFGRVSDEGFKWDVGAGDRTYGNPDRQRGVDVDRKNFQASDGGGSWFARDRGHEMDGGRDQGRESWWEGQNDTPIPEPPAYAIALGLAALGLVIWRRRMRLQIDQG
jgi:hypothetical protein